MLNLKSPPPQKNLGKRVNTPVGRSLGAGGREPSIGRRTGFTLIEVLVVVGIVTIIGTIASMTLFQAFKGTNKIDITNKVKQDGEFLLNTLERYVHGSRDVSVTNLSSPTRSLLNLTDYNGILTTITCYPSDLSSNGRMTYRTSLNPTEQNLTDSDPIKGISVAYCTFSLLTTSNRPATVSIEFILKEAVAAPGRSEFKVREVSSDTTTCAGRVGITSGICFKTTVSTRNY